jgi:predicted DNA-binding protein with PD1-like motif
MKSELLSESETERIFVLILDNEEEAFGTIQDFCAQEGISAATVTAIGAFAGAMVGWFDFQSRTYREIPVAEQCEVLSLIGDVAVGDDGKASLHLHAVLGLSDGSTKGGHFLKGTVHPTLEVVLREAPAHLRRRKRKDLGIALIDLETEPRQRPG